MARTCCAVRVRWLLETLSTMRRPRCALLSAQLRTSPNGSASSTLARAQAQNGLGKQRPGVELVVRQRQRHVVHMREAACLRHWRARHGGHKVGIQREPACTCTTARRRAR